MTLTDLIVPPHALYDAYSGQPIDDDPAEYEILARYITKDGYLFCAVRGPSGNIDVHGPDNGQLHRDVLRDAGPKPLTDNLVAFIQANYS